MVLWFSRCNRRSYARSLLKSGTYPLEAKYFSNVKPYNIFEHLSRLFAKKNPSSSSKTKSSQVCIVRIKSWEQLVAFLPVSSAGNKYAEPVTLLPAVLCIFSIPLPCKKSYLLSLYGGKLAVLYFPLHYCTAGSNVTKQK